MREPDRAVGDQVAREPGHPEALDLVEGAELAPVGGDVEPALGGGAADEVELVLGSDVGRGVLVEGADAVRRQRRDRAPGGVEALLGPSRSASLSLTVCLARRSRRPAAAQPSSVRTCGVSASRAWLTIAEWPSIRER